MPRPSQQRWIRGGGVPGRLAEPPVYCALTACRLCEPQLCPRHGLGGWAGGERLPRPPRPPWPQFPRDRDGGWQVEGPWGAAPRPASTRIPGASRRVGEAPLAKPRVHACCKQRVILSRPSPAELLRGARTPRWWARRSRPRPRAAPERTKWPRPREESGRGEARRWPPGRDVSGQWPGLAWAAWTRGPLRPGLGRPPPPQGPRWPRPGPGWGGRGVRRAGRTWKRPRAWRGPSAGGELQTAAQTWSGREAPPGAGAGRAGGRRRGSGWPGRGRPRGWDPLRTGGSKWPATGRSRSWGGGCAHTDGEHPAGTAMQRPWGQGLTLGVCCLFIDPGPPLGGGRRGTRLGLP